MSPASLTDPIPPPVRKLNMAAGLADAAGPPVEDCAILYESFAMFHRVFGENPVGNQQQIVRALIGDNPKNVAFVSPDHVSKDGIIADRWGTAYFFHQVSADLTEIISAGPDKQFGTSDDVQFPEATPSSLW